MVLVAACSSSDTKKTAGHVTPDAGASAGGGTPNGGVPDANASGGASQATAGAGGAGEAVGGEGATSMTDGWLSGTRLRAVLDVAGDAKLFKLWHDRDLDVDCAFAPDADGVERCLPISDHGYSRYSDVKCTKPVAVFEANDAIVPFAIEPFHPHDCDHGFAYLKVGADAAGVTNLYDFANGDCAANGSVGATQIVKQLGAVVPASMFVATTKTLREARDSRLSANVRVAEDGAREVINHFDLVRGVDCRPTTRDNVGYACVPQNLAFIEVFFSDDKCKVPAAYHPACGGDPAILIDSSPQNTGQYFEVGAPVAMPLFLKYSTTCQPNTAIREPGAGYYAVGKEAPWSGFAQLSSKNEGTASVAINVLRGASDELVARQSFFDSSRSVNCSVGQAADLQPRCLPRTDGASVNVFADAKCSSGLYEIKAGDPLPGGLDFLTANAPGGGTAVFKIGAKVGLPAQAWQMSGLNCQLRSVFAGMDYYSMTSIPPSALPLVKREVE